jgi:hypothetical protein
VLVQQTSFKVLVGVSPDQVLGSKCYDGPGFLVSSC